MADVIFYEKPGCAGNAKQKSLLKLAGHRLFVKNILTAPWSVETLRPFFGDKPIAEWFNRNAPQVKNGVIDLQCMTEEGAMRAMLMTPILIRRPLMEVDGVKSAGFDADYIDRWIGLSRDSQTVLHHDLEQCRSNNGKPCPQTGGK